MSTNDLFSHTNEAALSDYYEWFVTSSDTYKVYGVVQAKTYEIAEIKAKFKFHKNKPYVLVYSCRLFNNEITGI